MMNKIPLARICKGLTTSASRFSHVSGCLSPAPRFLSTTSTLKEPEYPKQDFASQNDNDLESFFDNDEEQQPEGDQVDQPIGGGNYGGGGGAGGGGFVGGVYGGGQEERQMGRRRYRAGLNRVELLGGVGQHPDQRVSKNGAGYTAFTLFTNTEQVRPNGEVIERTEMHNVMCFGPLAKFVANSVQKGSRVFVQGRLHYNGGIVLSDGSRSPRTASINAELVLPIARSTNYAGGQQSGGGYQGGGGGYQGGSGAGGYQGGGYQSERPE